MSAAESLSDRILALETVVSHLQHDVEQMHIVMLAQRGEIQSLQALIESFQGRLEEATKEPEQRNAEEERPPHY